MITLTQFSEQRFKPEYCLTLTIRGEIALRLLFAEHSWLAR